VDPWITLAQACCPCLYARSHWPISDERSRILPSLHNAANLVITIVPPSKAVQKARPHSTVKTRYGVTAIKSQVTQIRQLLRRAAYRRVILNMREEAHIKLAPSEESSHCRSRTMNHSTVLQCAHWIKVAFNKVMQCGTKTLAAIVLIAASICIRNKVKSNS
jgi:hypothetical protein